MTDLKSKVDEAKEKLGLSNKELSLKLGHSPKYITNALLESSDKANKMIIMKINALLDDIVIDDAMMISKQEYNDLKKELDHKNQVLDKRNDLLEMEKLKVQDLEKQIEFLKVDNSIITNELNEALHTYKSESKKCEIILRKLNDIKLENKEIKDDFMLCQSMRITAENEVKTLNKMIEMSHADSRKLVKKIINERIISIIIFIILIALFILSHVV